MKRYESFLRSFLLADSCSLFSAPYRHAKKVVSMLTIEKIITNKSNTETEVTTETKELGI
jgi:hypothetical protein